MQAIARAVRALEDFEQRSGRKPSLHAEAPFERFLAVVSGVVALLTHPHIEVPAGAVEHIEKLVREYEDHELRREDGP